MKRRDFLKHGLQSGAAMTTPFMLSSCKLNNEETVDQSQFKAQQIEPFNPNDPERLPAGVSKSALVIGGGIAGLASALKLAERGYKVTLREAAPYLGGRLHTRTENLKTGVFQVEHGLHMWFYQYYNFQAILEDLGVWDKYFRDFNEVFFSFRDYKPETVVSKGPYPLNLVNIVQGSPNMNILNALQTYRALPDIIFYNHSNHFKKFDEVNFFDWAGSTGVNKKFFDIIMEPAASVTLNKPELTSASEMLLNMHFYFIGHPNAFNRKVTTVDHGTAVINPWAQRLVDLGADIKINSPVSGLKFKNGSCVGTTDSNAEYDHVIVAADVPGTQKIMRDSQVVDSNTVQLVAPLMQKLSGLKTAPPYHVMRIWLDKPIGSLLDPSQAVIETPQFKPINLLAVFEMLEKESYDWATQNNGSIIELHLYDTPEFVGKSPEQIWESVKGAVIESFSQTKAKDLIKEAKPLEFSVGRFNNFTSYEVGQAKFKPNPNEGSTMGIGGLYFAGDWVNYDPFPNALMERAVTTGVEAANAILLKDNVRQVTVMGATPKGPGIFPKF